MSEPQEPLSYAPPQAKISGYAVTAMWLGIVAIPLDIALCFGAIPGLLAVIFGGIAIWRMRHNTLLLGKSYAIAGIVLGVISLLLATACGISMNGGIR